MLKCNICGFEVSALRIALAQSIFKWEEGCSKWFLFTFKKWWQKTGRLKCPLCYYYLRIPDSSDDGCNICILHDKDIEVCSFEFEAMDFEIAKNKPDFNIIKTERKKMLYRLNKLMVELMVKEDKRETRPTT